MAKELTKEEIEAKRLEEEQKAKRLAEAQKYMEEGLSSAEYKEPQSLNSSSNKSALSNFFKETEATRTPEGKNISLNKETTSPYITGKKTVSKDIDKFAEEYNPQKNTALVNALVDANALKERKKRQAQPDIAPALAAQRASEASVPSVSKVAGEENETTKPATETKEALKNVYAVRLSKREDKNKTFNTLKEAQDYFKEQGGRGAIATFKDRRTDKKSVEALQEEYRKKYQPEKKQWRPEVLAEEAKQIEEDKRSGRYSDPQARAENFAFGEQREAAATKARNQENQKAAKARLDEGFKRSGGRSMWDDQVDARKKQDAANKASFGKFQESVRSKDRALNSYNEYNKEKGLLNKAYNAALKSEDYGAALQLKQAMTRQGRGVPAEAGARMKYFEETQAEREKATIEAEEARRKKEAYDLARFEENRIANERYMASNPDAQFNNYSNANPFNKEIRLF
jgi:hypothetical protein